MKLLFRIIFLTGVVAFSTATIYPCSCEFWKPQKKLQKASAAFVGEVVAIESNNKDGSAPVGKLLKSPSAASGVKQIVRQFRVPPIAVR